MVWTGARAALGRLGLKDAPKGRYRRVSDRYPSVSAWGPSCGRARFRMLVMTTAFAIGLVLAAWTVLPFPLAVLVGRSLSNRATPSPEVALRPEVTPV